MKDETIVLLAAITGLTVLIVAALCMGCVTENCYVLSAGVGALVYILTNRKDLIVRLKSRSW